VRMRLELRLWEDPKYLFTQNARFLRTVAVIPTEEVIQTGPDFVFSVSLLLLLLRRGGGGCALGRCLSLRSVNLRLGGCTVSLVRRGGLGVHVHVLLVMVHVLLVVVHLHVLVLHLHVLVLLVLLALVMVVLPSVIKGGHVSGWSLTLTLTLWAPHRHASPLHREHRRLLRLLEGSCLRVAPTTSIAAAAAAITIIVPAATAPATAPTTPATAPTTPAAPTPPVVRVRTTAAALVAALSRVATVPAATAAASLVPAESRHGGASRSRVAHHVPLLLHHQPRVYHTGASRVATRTRGHHLRASHVAGRRHGHHAGSVHRSGVLQHTSCSGRQGHRSTTTSSIISSTTGSGTGARGGGGGAVVAAEAAAGGPLGRLSAQLCRGLVLVVAIACRSHARGSLLDAGRWLGRR